jgi:hypothetical protein
MCALAYSDSSLDRVTIGRGIQLSVESSSWPSCFPLRRNSLARW